MAHIEEDLLDQYAMGTLSEELIPEVEEHVLICTLCQTRLIETDELLAVFSQAATQMEARPMLGRPRTVTFRTGASIAAVALAGLALFLIAGPWQDTKRPAPSTILMQSFRGAESEARMASGKPVLLVFDVLVQAPPANYEIQVVDAVGNEVLKQQAELRNGRLTGLLGKLAGGSYWVRLYRTQSTRELVAEYGLRAE
jgi:hypothetical protein